MPVPEMAVSPVKTLQWEVFPPMATCRVYCTPVLWGGCLYVMGGCSENGMPLDSVEVLDLESQSWCQLPPLPTARAGASAVALGDQLVVMGGMDAQQSPLASVEIYHPDEGKWEQKAGLGQASMGITALEIEAAIPLVECALSLHSAGRPGREVSFPMTVGLRSSGNPALALLPVCFLQTSSHNPWASSNLGKGHLDWRARRG
ncbi:Kelch domain-containing protein 8B [Bagarius yarrelli]|uniref:Kelch domain-containing protein 8B n=1 Tax=Bagarius yarrelli TaxID=175774 RepID=A0A556U2G1_BAGYA|nr:Kelch domain-containing protein 8B [Bagarius yarrelli]